METRTIQETFCRTTNKVLDKAPNSTTIIQIRDSSKTVYDSKHIANALSSHFINVGSSRLASRIEGKPDDDPLSRLNNGTGETGFAFKHVNERTVLKYTQNQKQGKSADPDKIQMAMLKDAADLICKPLTMIFNSNLRLGTFPDRWKIAQTSPIHKSGAKDDTNNYRPI